MISFEKACEKAFNHYKNNPYFRMDFAVDIGDAWVFGNEWREPLEPGELRMPVLGWAPPCVMKETGEVRPFPVPPIENLERTRKGKRLEVPEKYKV